MLIVYCEINKILLDLIAVQDFAFFSQVRQNDINN